MRTALLTLTTCLLALPAQAQYSGGSGTADDPYQIATAADLITLGKTPDDYDKHFILTADIDLGGFTFDRAVIAPGYQSTAFNGYFDGQGHTIRNLSIQGSNNLGLFGRVASRATICSLGLEDVDVSSGLEGSWVGGLVGYNRGSITACYAAGTVSGDDDVGGLVGWNDAGLGDDYGRITSSCATATVSGDRAVGGLVGDNNGSVDSCYSTRTVRGTADVGGLVGDNSGRITSSYSTGTVRGNLCVGGLVGWNPFGSIISSYSTGKVNGGGAAGGLVGENTFGSITSSYSTGTVDGDWGVGGLVAGSAFGSTSTSFWDIQASGLTESAGGTGLTTAEMQTADTFLDGGWDFVDETTNGIEDIWWILEGQDYPRLWWEGITVLVVDDFESYSDDGQGYVLLLSTWISGLTDGTPGAVFLESEVVHDGERSLRFDYGNLSEPWYVETKRSWEMPQDWTVGDANTLTLCVRGEAANVPEPLYVAIEDTDGHAAMVIHPDANVLRATEWQTWHVSLAGLQADGVDVASVKKMIIGVGDRDDPQPGGIGRIYIDDIRVTNRMP